MRASTHAHTRTHRTCSHVVKTHYRTAQLDALLHPLRNITDRTNVLLQEFRLNLNREHSLHQITDETERRRVLIQSTVTRQCLWLRAGYLMGLNRGQHRLTSPQSWRSPIPHSSPSKPHQAILPDHPPRPIHSSQGPQTSPSSRLLWVSGH